MKKLRLTNLLSLILLMLAGFISFSCNNDVSEEATQDSLNETNNLLKESSLSRDGAKIDTAFVLESTREATVNFTNEIKSFYRPGMTYEDLKHELDPKENLANITPVGDALLLEAYSNIVNKVNDKNMNGLKMTQALKYIVDTHIKEGFTKTEEVNFENGSKELFGLDQNYNTTARAQSCKWYQIGCHLSNFWNWLAADANGSEPGSTTNGQVLGTVVTVISGTIGIISGVIGLGGN